MCRERVVVSAVDAFCLAPGDQSYTVYYTRHDQGYWKNWGGREGRGERVGGGNGKKLMKLAGSNQ